VDYWKEEVGYWLEPIEPHKSAEEFYNTKYPNHTRLLKRWVIELMEQYAQSTIPTEGKIQEILDEHNYAGQRNGELATAIIKLIT